MREYWGNPLARVTLSPCKQALKQQIISRHTFSAQHP